MKANSIALALVGILADGEFHSGEHLGKRLGISRAEINNPIQLLKEWGLDVLTITGKGYSLQEPIQLLDKEKITQQLDPKRIFIMSVVDSTNQYLLEHLDSLQSGDVCIAEHQVAGRGRRGRQWFSPFGSNLYLSMYWRLEQGSAATTGLSLVIGIVIAEVLKSLGAIDVKVKWPNDLYLYDRKLAGILVEIIGKTGDTAQIVIGAGINLVMCKSDTSTISQNWVNLREAKIEIDRNGLTILLIKKLRQALLEFERDGLAPFIDRWLVLDNYINRPIKLLIGKQEQLGISRGINQQGALLLEQNGVIKAWAGGEISLRAQ